MKKVLFVLLLEMAALTASAQNGRDIYDRYSDESGVNAVYISKTMFRLIGKLPDLEMNDEDVNLTELVKSLDGFYLIESSGNQRVEQKLKADVENYVKSSNYELLMEVKDDGETVRMYIISKGDDVKGFVMLISSDDECTFICLDGSMSRRNLEDVLFTALESCEEEEK